MVKEFEHDFNISSNSITKSCLDLFSCKLSENVLKCMLFWNVNNKAVYVIGMRSALLMTVGVFKNC